MTSMEATTRRFSKSWRVCRLKGSGRAKWPSNRVSMVWKSLFVIRLWRVSRLTVVPRRNRPLKLSQAAISAKSTPARTGSPRPARSSRSRRRWTSQWQMWAASGTSTTVIRSSGISSLRK